MNKHDFMLFTFGFVLSSLIGWAENRCDIGLGSAKKKIRKKRFVAQKVWKTLDYTNM